MIPESGETTPEPEGDPKESKRKKFTVNQANGTLPLVRRIVTDIVEGHKGFHSARRRFDEIKGGISGTPTSEEGSELRHLEEEAESSREKVETCIEELEMVGCQLKDFEMGLIDFPSEKDGKPILLCWKLGEDRVSFWHSMAGGYSGRQPLPI